ncbi:MAG: sigma-54 dependent transcriptional regulator [Terracidiphilus sp.]|jgi:DNA-binding NtrC family response regulator
MASAQEVRPIETHSGRKFQIAVLDANPAVLDYVHRILASRYSVSLFTEAEALNTTLRESQKPDLILVDCDLAEDKTAEDSLAVLASIHVSNPTIPIIMLACSASAGLNQVLAAARLGAVDVILKPFGEREIHLAVQQCLKKRHVRAGDEDAEEIPLDEDTSFVRSCKRMREIEAQSRLVARADIPVLILGESGTGKEVAAMLIHKLSARSKRSFLKVNCAAMPADLLESELFGYEQGAFTGAVKSKPGKFEICNQGTIFLDEIAEMPPSLQAKLLQVLQDGSFARLGSRSTVKVDVRVIAATNINIKEAIAHKTFREDLYYRLNGFTLHIPPLRERTEEIPILCRHFMRKVVAKYECDPLPISPALMQAMVSHTWPGNLRELENTIKRYLVLADEHAIINELIPWQHTQALESLGDIERKQNGLKHLVRNLKGGAEAVAIAQSLERSGWNRKAAACELQISYKALLYKIKQYNLSPPPRRPESVPASLTRFERAQSSLTAD